MENIGFSLMTSDLLDNILSRLPAKSFASAAAVRKDWNSACSRILSRPKLSSAISFNPVPLDALQELFEKVMSEPIRPHFVMASVGLGSEFDDILQFMVKKFGSRTPIIVVCAKGILGRDARTQEFREVVWTENTDEEITVNTGTELTVGFVPGLKVDVIPLLRRSEAEPPNCSMPMVYKFVRDIKNFTSPVSDRTMSTETIIVGEERCQYVYRSNATSNVEQSTDAVALVFARDRSNKAHGIGNIEFHFAASNGSTAIGPKFKVVYRTEKEDYYVTELAARREGEQEILGAQQKLEVTDDYKIENNFFPLSFHIAVTRPQNYSVGSNRRRQTTLQFHEVEEKDFESFFPFFFCEELQEYLQVGGVGIKNGDSFQFYVPDPRIASSSREDGSSALRALKLEWDSTVANVCGKMEPFGGFVFGNMSRVRPFFGQHNIESSPLLDNFPGIPVAGIFGNGDIGRGNISLNANERDPYSTVYVLMSYTPRQP
ncbi:F-box family protein, putative isoform 3 [Hibiscus syriacus]|uniref:F-box family protein, putative isoform 3 n=1 Tax=Hibiscus syriacus TaxID=106335 RepID=A0A6A3AKP2_HIBSY|nr:F-box family protein, putative isoform 3 [Hibiscus syriacus]